MADEKDVLNEELESQDTSAMYLEQIKNLKANSVSKEAYDKILNENRNLLQTIVEGNSQPVSAETNVTKRPIKEIREDLFKGQNNNLQFIEKSLELRDRIMESGGVDPFLPVGHNIVPTDEDIAAANRVAQVFSECVEYAQGDSEVFTNELQRRTIDTGIRRRK